MASDLSETVRQLLASIRGSTSPIFMPGVTETVEWMMPRKMPSKGATIGMARPFRINDVGNGIAAADLFANWQCAHDMAGNALHEAPAIA